MRYDVNTERYEFQEEDYCLFLETNVGYEISLNYFEYNVLLDTREGDLSLNIGNYTLQKSLGAERYELMPDHRMEQLEDLIQKIWNKSPSYYCNALYSFDEYGKLLEESKLQLYSEMRERWDEIPPDGMSKRWKLGKRRIFQ